MNYSTSLYVVGWQTIPCVYDFPAKKF